MLLFLFYIVPVSEDLFGRVRLNVAENVRVAQDQLPAYAVRDVVKVELVVLLRDARVKDDLKQKVAELLLHQCHVVLVYRLDNLVGLLDEVAADRVVVLLAVPRAAAGLTQDRHYLDQIADFVVFFGLQRLDSLLVHYYFPLSFYFVFL